MFVATLPDCFGDLELADSMLLLAVKPNPDLNGRQFDFLLMQRITGGGGVIRVCQSGAVSPVRVFVSPSNAQACGEDSPARLEPAGFPLPTSLYMGPLTST